MPPARASFRLLPQPAGSLSRVAALALCVAFTEVPISRALPSDTPWHPTTWIAEIRIRLAARELGTTEIRHPCAGRLARSPGTIGRHAGTTRGRERAPPKRCHRGQHPPGMSRRKGQPPECSPSAPTSSGCSCTVTIWFGGQLTLAALVPVLCRPGTQVPRAATRPFNQITWPALAVVVATGIRPSRTRSPEATGQPDRQARCGTGAGCHGLLARPLAQHTMALRSPAPSPAPARWAALFPGIRLSPSSQAAPRGLLVTVTRRFGQSRSSLARTAASLISGCLVAVIGGPGATGVPGFACRRRSTR